MKTIEERITDLQAKLSHGRSNGSMEFDIIGDQARINELSMLSDNGDLRTIQVVLSESFDIDTLVDSVGDALRYSSNVSREQMDVVMNVLYKLKKTIRA